MHVCLRYWVLQDGRAVNWSVKELADKKPDELVAPNTREAYHLVGEELQYEPLGMLPDEECGSQRHIRQLPERSWQCVIEALLCSEARGFPRPTGHVGRAVVEAL